MTRKVRHSFTIQIAVLCDHKNHAESIAFAIGDCAARLLVELVAADPRIRVDSYSAFGDSWPVVPLMRKATP